MADLKVAFPSPCSEPWEGMTQLGRNRHCATCDKIIHDLSALRLAEVEDLLESGEQVCVRARVGRDGVVALADTAHRKRRMVATVGASVALATAACQTTPPEDRLDRFEITGTLPMIHYGKPVVRSNDGQTWPVELAHRSAAFRVPDLYPGVYSITYEVGCGDQPRVLENVVIRDSSIDLGRLEDEGDCIVVGLLVPAERDRAG
jgi:hypothetical protein